MSNNWVITGANGNLGRRLISTLAASQDRVTAVVRSARAAETIVASLQGLSAEASARVQTQVLNYTDDEALGQACEVADYVVHLVGIIKEGAGTTYADAHEASTDALCAALASRSEVHVTYLSIFGSRPDSDNPCLASKGRAEERLRQLPNPVCVLRVPMVLGEDDYVSQALRGRVLKGQATGFRMASLEQPLFAGDVVRAVLAAAAHRVDQSLDLGGPEVLSRAELSRRAGAVFGREVATRSLPIVLGKLLAGILEGVSSNPPVTRAMLEILDHDDEIDNAEAIAALQLGELTSVDEMLITSLAGNGLTPTA